MRYDKDTKKAVIADCFFYVYTSQELCHFNVFLLFRLCGLTRQSDMKHAILNLSLYLIALNIIRQRECLLVVAV